MPKLYLRANAGPQVHRDQGRKVTSGYFLADRLKSDWIYSISSS
jgi:hypothetical protein